VLPLDEAPSSGDAGRPTQRPVTGGIGDTLSHMEMDIHRAAR
jgi:hypothetical protein